jgi:hypothetical protein
MNIYISPIIFIVSIFTLLNGQEFIQPYKQLPYGNEAIIITSSGEEIKGTLKSGSGGFDGYLKKLTIIDGKGTKRKFVSETGDVVSIKIKLEKKDKFFLAAETAGKNLGSGVNLHTLSKLGKKDFKEVLERDYMLLQRELSHKKKSKYVWMQLLNPGYHGKIKIYQDAFARETKGFGGLGGGVTKSYMVVKGDNKAIKIKKKKYKKEFKNLFGDCAVMMEHFGDSKIKWKDFAKHVFLYDQSCE